MDDLTPEDDLKPDTSDRRPPRARKPSPSIPKVAVSRQYVMIGIGIVVLVLLIVGIGSAMKSSSSSQPAQQNNGPKDISLAGNDAAAPAQPSAQAQANTAQAIDGQQPADGQQPKSIGLPPVSPTPTEAQPVPDNGQAKERVDLPGDMSDALSSQQNQVDGVAQGSMAPAAQSLTSLPTAPATVNGSARTQAPAGSQPSAPHTRPAQALRNAQPAHTSKPAEHKTAATASHTAKTPVTKSTASSAPVASAPAAASGSMSGIKSAPGTHFTLQLSGASQSNTLNAFAKQQGLKNYLVYQTAREGKPWFVLVSGNYASSAEAKRAISSLPAEVQAKKPWVKPVHQVQQDLKK
ncbi:SPOR domain-containing protein [Rahnella perminowiae]|uniref:SPOR domain-containing protein n=1 Tax=Rahnella perminowiae TaxID=2816244 RepID=UPI0036527562